MAFLNFKRSALLILLAAFPFIFFGACAPVEKRYDAAPSLLPGTDRMMKTAGFWIGRHPDPDRVFLDSPEIEKLNRYLEAELELTRDVLAGPGTFSREEILSFLEEDRKNLTGRMYYGKDGREAGPGFFDPLDRNVNPAGIPEQSSPRFALVVHFADQRALPTPDPLYARRGDRDFDELQTSALDIGTPLCVLLESLDGAWVYVLDPLYRGWVEKKKVAFGTREDLENYLRPDEFAVVISDKADLYLDPLRTVHHDHVRMGVRFPLSGDPAGTGECAGLLLPVRREDGTLSLEKAYASESDLHRGFLPLTPRSMLEQAFRLMNAPYGWGGLYGEQDCSRFIEEIFATAGIRLPRNSSKQAEAGLLLDKFDKDTSEERKIRIITDRAAGGVTLLYMKGHILLYAGHVNDTPYAIHALWGYREKSCCRDRVRVTNRVVLSDLTLGRGTKKGSFLDRLISVRMLSPMDTPFL